MPNGETDNEPNVLLLSTFVISEWKAETPGTGLMAIDELNCRPGNDRLEAGRAFGLFVIVWTTEWWLPSSRAVSNSHADNRDS